MASGGAGANHERLLKEAAKQIQRSRTPIRYKRKNFFVFAGLLTSVFGIYFYSMYSIQQEKIDFEK